MSKKYPKVLPHPLTLQTKGNHNIQHVKRISEKEGDPYLIEITEEILIDSTEGPLRRENCLKPQVDKEWIYPQPPKGYLSQPYPK